MNCPLSTPAISRVLSWGLGYRLWQIDVVVALPWLKEVIYHPSEGCHQDLSIGTQHHFCAPSQERGHSPPSSFTCKSCLKISAHTVGLQVVRQEQHPSSSCSPAPQNLVQVWKTCAPHWSSDNLPTSSASKGMCGYLQLSVPPFLPQEYASRCQSRQAKPNHHNSDISFCGYNYLLFSFFLFLITNGTHLKTRFSG